MQNIEAVWNMNPNNPILEHRYNCIPKETQLHLRSDILTETSDL